MRFAALACLFFVALPLSAQSVTATQLSGAKFRISGAGAKQGKALIRGATPDQTKAVDVAADGTYVIVCDNLRPGPVGVTNSDGTAVGSATLTNAAPSIPTFAITVSSGTMTLSGTVADDAPGGLAVQFSGPLGIDGFEAATVNANGTWTVTMKLPRGTTSGSVITAKVTDWFGLSDAKMATLP